ncbi:anillin isoform X2 [Corythoichthys intestinalis]|uniref:anillin isoform X2 n=1 Tax=Corythoichthys intestinalis TaxID=161448 RepID=UPI0025A638EB|nr:anillin isoform X2 [Corythoichthys intestinalis]
MDPFTEKLLERTRARRENLQKKMAARPNAAERQMAKRTREPLTDTNGPVARAVIDEVPQTSSKPSPSKRRCSAENVKPVVESGPILPDPPTDKKPPTVPACVRPIPSAVATDPAPPAELKTVQLEPQKMATHQRTTSKVPVSPAREDPDSVAPAAGMKSRLQRLAEQRKCWDSADSGSTDATPPSPSRSDVRLPTSAASRGGRRERLAVLAATIGTWEDDTSRVDVSKEKEPDAGFASVRARVVSVKRNDERSAVSNGDANMSSPDKSDTPATKSALDSVTSSHGPPSSQSSSQSSVKSPDLASDSQKANMSGSAVPQAKNVARPPGVQVKSFLDRFQERCQEHANSPAGGNDRSPAVLRSATPSNTPVRNRFLAAPAAKTATADLAEKHKLERESELAQIRRCHQKNHFWKNKDEQLVEERAEPHAGTVSSAYTENPERAADGVVASVRPKDESKSHLIEAVESDPPDDTETHEDKFGETTKEDDGKAGWHADRSVDSAVIDDLFEGVLEQEEEDALNISSMSLLTPVAESVAAVVKSPQRSVMTSTPACSFLEKNETPDDVSQPSKFQRANIRSVLSDSIEEDHKLLYSIDAYRSVRLKEPEKEAPVKKDAPRRAEEVRGPALFSLKQKLKILTNEMNLQQTIIHQASQALNCCTDEEHGKGSQVEAEAERLLLVATEKREALKTELQRLKGEGQKKEPTASESVSPSEGSVCLQELRLPLKADFVCSAANKAESTKHSFFLMIRAGAENTVATPLASTHRGLSGDTLTFPTKFSVSHVSSEFAIDLEVYCLIQKREIGGDKKKKASKSKAITPKRFLAITKGAQTPVVASPGGPGAVRTSNFVLVGSHKLTLSSIGAKRFPLEKVPFLCPLEGHVYLQMLCQVSMKVEEKGFLTMFEDVSGFGAWHRRWCILSGNCISYWTYPNDEKTKNPIGRINLANCTTKSVEPVNREFCARPNTFELITIRPQREDDKETLVSHCKNTMCVTKNWLSTDTKDERNVWMKKLNQVLMDLRMWQPDACYKPL